MRGRGRSLVPVMKRRAFGWFILAVVFTININYQGHGDWWAPAFMIAYMIGLMMATGKFD
jgi:hypothetical protein